MPAAELPMEARFRTLERAVTELGGNVTQLVEALNVVGQLSRAQQEQATRQEATERLAAAAAALSRSRLRALKRVQRITAIAIALIVPAVSLLAYWSLTVQVNHQFQKEQDDLATSCQLRNEANVIIPSKRELALAEAYRALNDPVMTKIHQDSADAMAATLVDCSIYRKSAP